MSSSGGSASYGYQIHVSIPNVFGSFEATLGVFGAEVFLLFVFLICTWRLSCKDVAKPFLCLLSLCMLISTTGTICLFVFKMCRLSNDALAYASIVRTIGRFSSVNSLLFGGGYLLLGAGNAVRTRSPSPCSSSWFLHFTIFSFSVIVAVTKIFCSYSLENIPLFLFKTMPVFGFLFLLFGLVMGFLISCCGDTQKEIESRERSLVEAKSRFFSFVLFFIEPVALVCITRVCEWGE
ncbi:hypothetical protein PMAYCL1PPCAC_18010 [Pristionchus mayeri]|uniref:Uncharacterized protein n=1 Tax=Pristionchus mayeri TaxID=1317129 RepID=A0AAN5CP21_9BILA|nr:hypothetical protein PMAYCL1PPCAC_18010 [Pristionchus mayeri]